MLKLKDCKKLIKNHTKTLVFTTLDISQLKKIDDRKNIHSVNPLYLPIDHLNNDHKKCLFS